MSRATSLIESPGIVLDQPNIDTDQIIPARFLRTTERDGLGQHAFADWRLASDGSEDPDCPLNKPAARGAAVVIAGPNFGCGSSREHAAWALADFGIRAVISTAIADIFQSNALKNGIAPLIVDESAHAWLVQHAHAGLTIDLSACEVRCAERTLPFTIDAFGRRCLIEGVDALGFLMRHQEAIHGYEETLTCAR